MEAYRIDRFGSVDGIVLRSSDDPRPGLREVLMRLRASSLNYRDLMVLKGGGRGPTKRGVVPLSDGAGEVAAIGDGVTRVKVGDGLQGHFIRDGLAARSGRNTSPTGLALISTGCWRNTRC
jgi:NADPH:quinone reductase-like Zn-dependent oxidoreductase